MNLSLIAAIGKNNELGKDNDLIWHLPSDLKFFKEQTLNKTIVMGYNTYLSLPRKLVDRQYIVITKKDQDLADDIIVCHSIEEFLTLIKDREDEVFVIGGASIYHQLIDYCSKMYLTEIDATADADVYFPEFNHDDYTEKVIDERIDNGIKYKHMIYRRK